MSSVSGEPLENKSDAELVELARGRDKDAFGVIAQRYEATARRFAARLAGERGWASEALQEALLEAYLSLEHLRDPSKFRAWLCGIVLNVNRRYARQQRHPSVSLEVIEGSRGSGAMPASLAQATPQLDAERSELRLAVAETLKALAPAFRKAIFLFYFDGLSITEIASLTGDSEGAVKVRLYRARQQLKERLKADHPDLVPGVGRKLMISVTIADVVKIKATDASAARSPLAPEQFFQHVIVLKDEAGRRALPIWVGPFEGESIAAGMEKFKTPRPMTYDFVSSLLKAIDARIEEVRVEALKDSTFYAIVKVWADGVVREIDARPSDALAIAVRTGSPIFVAEDVMKTAGLTIPDGAEKAPHEGIRNIVNDLGEQVQRSKSRPVITQESAAKMIDELMTAVFKK
jgi:RNA polymerase sigma factor (sigma-70 family)